MDTFATEGTVCCVHILTTLGVVFLKVGAQIFSQPSAVSTEPTVWTKFIGFKRFFPSKANTSTSVQRLCSIKSRSHAATEMPSLAQNYSRMIILPSIFN